MATRIDYDRIAATYNSRFVFGSYDSVLQAMLALIAAKKPEAVLEVGCGTGYWLGALRPEVPGIIGLDYSLEMLRKARDRQSIGRLVRADAEVLPFRYATFDLIFCVNAIHHFGRFYQFIAEARRLLLPGGILAVIGMDPHHGLDRWCVYDFFPETKATDLARYPSSGQLIDAMLRAGFSRVECKVACRFFHTWLGRTVFADPELQRNGCSQMALLSDKEYAAGIERIESAILRSTPRKPAVFKVDIAIMMQCGQTDN